MPNNPFVVFRETYREEYARQVQKWGLKSKAPQNLVRIQEASLDTESLQKNFGDAMSTLGSMFAGANQQQYGPLQIDSMEVNLEVSAEGKLAFLGTGGSLSGKTSFKIQFKRMT